MSVNHLKYNDGKVSHMSHRLLKKLGMLTQSISIQGLGS